MKVVYGRAADESPDASVHRRLWADSRSWRHCAGVGGGSVRLRDRCRPNGSDVKLQAASTRERTSGAPLAARKERFCLSELQAAWRRPSRAARAGSAGGRGIRRLVGFCGELGRAPLGRSIAAV